MISIKDKTINEILIKKSKFITFLYRVDDIDSIQRYLDELNQMYSDATHICYAYILDSFKKMSDDGEPSGTAGMPILNVLENKNLDHILCCVVRYFGGVKLGANGLLRAYSNSCIEAINCSSLVDLTDGKICSLSFSYDNTRIVNLLLKDSFVISKKYDDNVTYVFKISMDNLNKISDDIKNYGVFNEIRFCYIEKEH